MASGDTKTQQYLDIAARGTRADLQRGCCNTRTQDLIMDVAERIITEEETRAAADQVLQSEIDEIKNNPDVVDIVPTYAALQNYDTSGLTDKDIIRVLADETHDGASTYYRYSTATGTFTYIGESKQYEDFVGTDGTAGGQNGLVPAPVATDAGKFLNANGSWEEVQAGGIIELTSADYNYPAANPDGVAMWLLDEGIYTRSSSVKVYLSTSRIVDTQYQEFIITPAESSGGAPVMGIVYLSHVNPIMYYAVVNTNGVEIGSPVTLLTSETISQSTGTSTTSVMSQNAVSRLIYGTSGTSISYEKLRVGVGGGNNQQQNGSAEFGKGALTNKSGQIAFPYTDLSSEAAGVFGIGVYNTSFGYNNSNYRLLTGLYDGQSAHDAATKGQLDSIAIQNAGAPTTATVGTVGQLLEDTTNGKLYQCTAVSGNTYTWTEIGAGGSGPTVVQTTGTSTTDVMSQNAVTRMVFDPNNTSKIKIGTGVNATQNNSVTLGAYTTNYGQGGVAIGWNSSANSKGSVALGAQSNAAGVGVVSIGGMSDASYGYNNSIYRLLTGLYDPQSDHDAATKGYVDPTTDSSAPTTATVGRLGQIYIDTSTATAYMCVAADDVTPSYTWKQITA